MASLTITQLLDVVLTALEDLKGKDIKVFNTVTKTSAFSRAVVVTGSSNRQTRALASAVARAVREARGKVRGIEGTETGDWVLVDLGAIIVHCMHPDSRRYYNLEELWPEIEIDRPVRDPFAVPQDATVANF